MEKKNRLGVVVPFRNRYEHLEEFLDRVPKYLQIKGIPAFIIIVEQDNASAFNRGMLCNIGFLKAKEMGCDYVVFHDIDMIPLDVDYSYSNVPIHLATDRLDFDSYFGGITLFPTGTFEKINGFSNIYWGWGFEDDDLRYRCIQHNIPFQKKESIETTKSELAIFNGVDSFIEIPNTLNFYRDFSITLDFYIDKLSYNPEKSADTFTLFCIEGYDLKITYNSFNRFYFEVFDSEHRHYSCYSSIIANSFNSIKLEYSKKLNKFDFIVNDEIIELQLESKLYRYSKNSPIIIGANSKGEEFFKGALKSLVIQVGDSIVNDYIGEKIEEYTLLDNIDNNQKPVLYKIYYDYFTTPILHNSYIPFRRSSRIKYLNHENNGFINGRWKDDLTRWNELRYNNEVSTGARDSIEDGLSTCEYTLYGETVNKNVIRLNVGI